MYNCDGCYYEERLPQEACNVCHRDENGRMTGYVAREENESGDNNRSACCDDSDNPSTADAVPLPLHKGGFEKGHTQGARQGRCQEGLDASETSMEENLLEQIEELQQELVVLQEKENLKQLLIEELRAATQKLMEERDDYAAQCDALIEQLKRMQQEKEELEARLEKESAQGSYYKQWLDDERRCRELADAKLEMVHLIFGGGGNG